MKDSRRKEIRPKNNSTILDLTEINSSGQERIAEKLSISIPAPNVPRPNPALGAYIGQRVRLLLRDGAVITAIFTKMQWDYLRLDGVEEIGKDGKLTADWCLIQADNVVRVYPATAKAEPISKV